MGGKSKENLQLRLWNLNICIEKVDAKEMLIDRDDISDDIIALGTCFSMFVYIRADWQKSDSSVDREPPECPRVLALRLETSDKHPNFLI